MGESKGGLYVPRVTFWDGVRWLHLLAMAFFVGGQLFLAGVVVPVLRGRAEMRPVARRFAWGTLGALAILLVTGSAQAGHFGEWGDGTLQVKLVLVALTGGAVVWHMRRPALRGLEGVIFLASLVIVALGVALAHG